MDERFYLPIIYLRGFVFGSDSTDEVAGDPFYGFNAGSTQIRQDATGQTQFFVFESPVIRLITSYGYRNAYHVGVRAVVSTDVSATTAPEIVAQLRFDEDDKDGKAGTLVRKATIMTQQARGAVGLDVEETGAGRRSLWIYRYYDQASSTFGGRERRREEIEESALGLHDLIVEVLRQTAAPRVILIGHSTGGLIIRCLLQRTFQAFGQDPRDFVDKVFTYATPHGGIHFARGGWLLEAGRDLLGGVWDQSNFDDFGPRRMREYLTPLGEEDSAEPWDPRVMSGTFPVERVFCLVGTNAEDYGLPRLAVGPRSDGLVQIESAYVKNAPRAYVHRSHSGRYGIVNSEEGFQNLERFLFGDLQVQVELHRLDRLVTPRDENDLRSGEDRVHLIDAMVSIRQLPTLMHDQQLQHYTAVPLELEKLERGEPIPIFRAFLMRRNAPEHGLMRYSVRFRLHRVDVTDGRQQMPDHLEQVGQWEDTLICDLGDDDTLYTAWASDHPDWQRGPGEPRSAQDVNGAPAFEIGLSTSGRQILGANAVVRLMVQRWNYWYDDPRSEPEERRVFTRLDQPRAAADWPA